MMMLAQNDNIRYDMFLEEYYITPNAITNYTAYNSNDLSGVFGGNIEKNIKVISHNVYRLIYSIYTGLYPNFHRKFMKKKIYLNQQDEVKYLMLAMIEAVKGAIESGMDLNAYINEPKNTLPQTVKQELANAKLLDRTEKINYNLDIEYTGDEYDAT